MNKSQILDRLEEMVILLELNDANPFKVRAYQNGLRALETAGGDLASLIADKALGQIKGIGKGLQAQIETLFYDQPDPDYEALKAQTPPGLLEMLSIPGLGPKKVKKIYDELGISTLGELEYACHENRLVSMKGFGAKTQENILKGLAFLAQKQGLFLYPFAAAKAQELLELLNSWPELQQVALAGSLRRKKEVVKDIDLIGACPEEAREAIMARFTSLEQVEQVLGQGPTKSSVCLKAGMQVDLRLVSPQAFPHLLQHMTGSKEHNTALRGRARELGYKVNEYGLFKAEEAVFCADEAEIYAHLQLAYIPPELREDCGELEAAAVAFARHTPSLEPELVKPSDIKGIFHAHSTWSDGAYSLKEMALHCKQLGYEYLGISEHSQTAVYAHGLEVERVKAQWQEIDELNAELAPFQILKGIEVDILPDGNLDYDEALLAGFDFVIASVHSKFKMSETEMTARILKAAAHPAVTMIGHLTGRILLGREGYPVNVAQVIEACAAQGTLIELNAHPSRLDLDWRWGQYAREKGLMISINPDAHSTEGVSHVNYGVGVARKGGFGPQQVLNTQGLNEVRNWLQARKAAAASK